MILPRSLNKVDYRLQPSSTVALELRIRGMQEREVQESTPAGVSVLQQGPEKDQE